MRVYFLIFLFTTILFGQKYNNKNIEYGKRGDKYRLWIYFIDKDGSEKVAVSPKTIKRRSKNQYFHTDSWYDFAVSPYYINQISLMDIEIKNESRWLNAISVICSKKELDKIANLSFVKKIEPVIGRKRIINENQIDVNVFSRDLDYGNGQNQIEQINAHELHNQGYTGDGIRILILDTGFDLIHNALNNINVIDQWDVINDDNETANQTDDEESSNQDYHGTAVLSTIAAYAPGELIGVAYDAEFLLAKTEDVTQEIQQEEDNYVAALEWGEENGADVVSTSLGYLDWYDYSDLDGNTAITTIAVDIAVGLGMVCVTSAGNSGNDDWYYIIAPADADSVISVGAVRYNGEIASFSSHGPTADGRIKPEVCAQGVQTWCINPNNATNYIQLSGTSLACPLVSGVVALIIQARPTWTAMEIREAIMMTASMSDSANNNYGYGIINALNAIAYNITTGLDEKINVNTIDYNIIRTYPNPFNPSINIEIMLTKIDHTIIDILSYTGQFHDRLYNQKPDNKKLEMTWHPIELPSGIYFLKVATNNEVYYKKVSYIK